MIQAKCIQKFRNKHNQIIGYRLQDRQGNLKDVTSDQLKYAISQNKINIINLTLTSDNRLIDKTPQSQQPTNIKPQQSQQEIDQKIKEIIAIAHLIGAQIKEIPTACNQMCQLISLSATQYVIIIPDNITMLNRDWNELVFTGKIQKIQGAIKVLGGKNLQDTVSMFKECQAQSLDLSSFNTSNVTSMSHMFNECQAQSLDLSSFNTSNVTEMDSMFEGCKAKSLDLSSFNTSKVTSMFAMFRECQAQSLDLSSFNTSNETSTYDMFKRCQAQIIVTDPKILEVYNNK